MPEGSEDKSGLCTSTQGRADALADFISSISSEKIVPFEYESITLVRKKSTLRDEFQVKHTENIGVVIKDGVIVSRVEVAGSYALHRP